MDRIFEWSFSYLEEIRKRKKNNWNFLVIAGQYISFRLLDVTSLIDLNSPISSKNYLILTDWSSMASKSAIPVLFWGMNRQKYKFSLIYGTFSVEGCWGLPMLLFWKVVDETQIFNPHPEPAVDHNLIKLIILQPFIAIYFRS